jgi:methionyl-tRNA formyltransferase
MRLVFAGTPEPAVPSLSALLESRHEVVGVITRPDARSGRGRKVSRSPVGQLADDAGIPLLQPRRAGDPDFLEELGDLKPDVCPVVAYGALLPPAALAVPPLGWINLHFSLLPAWRGAAPVQYAIRHGDDITGASTFLIEAGMDTGPIYGVATENIGDTDTSGDLLARLANSGAGLLVATLDGVEAGELVAEPQPSDGVSMAPKVKVEDARIDWTQPALAIDRLVRSCTPEPGAWTMIAGQRLKVLPIAMPAQRDDSDGTIGEERPANVEPGVLVQVAKNRWLIGTATTPVELQQVQPQGKKVMVATDWLRGLRTEPGVRFE